MIDRYFSAPKTLRRLRDGLSGPYIDAFAEALTRDCYAPATVVRETAAQVAAETKKGVAAFSALAKK